MDQVKRGGRPGCAGGRAPGRSWRALWLAAALVCAAPARLQAATATLAWDANREPGVVGYRIHYGLASGKYTEHADVGNKRSYTVGDLMEGNTYYFVVTAYDRFGNESNHSKEVRLTTASTSVESVAAPAPPAGPAFGQVGALLTYAAVGGRSTAGHPVQYRFSWSDGSMSEWLPVGVVKAGKSWSAPGAYGNVAVESRCSLHPGIVSAPSPGLAVVISAGAEETISPPMPPSGPTSGAAGTLYRYTTGGATSSRGDPVQYRFSWADGTLSGWLPAAAAFASKAWPAAGTYTQVRAEARCALHQSALSEPSRAVTVTIAGAQTETVSAPSAPEGPSAGVVDVAYPFSTGGAASSAGDQVELRIHWGDGTATDWAVPGQRLTDWKSWGIPGMYTVYAEAACQLHPSLGALSAGADVAVTERGEAGSDAYVLWTREDSGVGTLWRIDPTAVVDPAAGATIPVLAWASLEAPDGAGTWRAAALVRGEGTERIVLWARGETRDAAVWKYDAGQLNESSSGGLVPAAGWASLGAPPEQPDSWRAAGFALAAPARGYALWTRDTGDAALCAVDTAAIAGSDIGGALGALDCARLEAPEPGAQWRAVAYAHAGANEGYLLWSRAQTADAQLWRIDPAALEAAAEGALVVAEATATLRPPTPDAEGWEAAGYWHRNGMEGHVLWTRAAAGRAVVGKIDPGALSGTGSAGALGYAGWQDVYSSAGIGSPWRATGHVR